MILKFCLEFKDIIYRMCHLENIVDRKSVLENCKYKFLELSRLFKFWSRKFIVKHPIVWYIMPIFHQTYSVKFLFCFKKMKIHVHETY